VLSGRVTEGLSSLQQGIKDAEASSAAKRLRSKSSLPAVLEARDPAWAELLRW
jgi:hypothetical protein